jgi:hypothetical protein
VTVRLPEGRVHSETGGSGEGVVGRRGARTVTSLSLAWGWDVLGWTGPWKVAVVKE